MVLFLVRSQTRNLLKPCLNSISSRGFLNSSSSDPSWSTSPDTGYHGRKILPYTQEQLYNVISDVDSYHLFVPYCTVSKVLSSKTVDPPGSTMLPGQVGPTVMKEAELTVGFLTLRERYISEVTCVPYLSVQAVASSATPLFKELTTTWRFQPANPTSPHPGQEVPRTQSPSTAGGPTLVSIDLVYSFSNPIHSGISGTFFGKISKMMVSAFEQRCLEVYGPGTK